MNCVTQEQIDSLLKNATIEVQTILNKCTIVVVQLKNGFILTESSACVDPDNYDEKIGVEICLEHIENRLWEINGYALQKKFYEESR